MSTALRRALQHKLDAHLRRKRRENITSGVLFAASFAGLAALALLPSGSAPFVALGSIIAGACAAMMLSD